MDVQISASYQLTIQIFKQTNSLQIDKLKSCEYLQIEDDRLIIPRLTFIGFVKNKIYRESKRMKITKLEVQDISKDINKVTIWVFDDKMLKNDEDEIYIFFGFLSIFNEVEQCVQFRINQNSKIAQISMFTYLKYFDFTQISQQEADNAQEQLQLIPHIKTKFLLHDPFIIRYQFEESLKQKYIKEGITLSTIQKLDTKILKKFEGMIFNQYIPGTNESYMFIDVSQDQTPNFIRIKIVNIANLKLAAEKYSCGSRVLLQNLKLSCQKFNLTYVLHDGNEQVSVKQFQAENQSIQEYQKHLSSIHDKMPLSLFSEIEFLTLDRKIRKIKVDLLRCQYYCCYWECKICRGMPIKKNNQLICQNQECKKLNLTENDISFQQFSIAIVQDLTQIAIVKLINDLVSQFYKISNDVEQYLKETTLFSGERLIMNYNLNHPEPIKKLNIQLYQQITSKFIICQNYCDQYLAQTARKKMRDRQKQNKPKKYFEENTKINEEDLQNYDLEFDELIGMKYEWFEIQEDRKLLKVNLNGGYFLKNNEAQLESILCFEVFKVQDVDYNSYFPFLDNILRQNQKC